MHRAARYRRRLAREQDATSVYRALASRRTGEDREILLALAQAEERHAAHWAAKLDPGRRMPARSGVRARTLGWLARRLGSLIVSFAAGAAIPILPFLVTTGTAAIVAAGIVVGVALLATGATVGVLTGGSLLRRGLRQLGIGVAAAVVTYGLGRLFGTAIG